jgi:hypothetical protein
MVDPLLQRRVRPQSPITAWLRKPGPSWTLSERTFEHPPARGKSTSKLGRTIHTSPNLYKRTFLQVKTRSILPSCVHLDTLRAARSEDPWALKRRFVMFT